MPPATNEPVVSISPEADILPASNVISEPLILTFPVASKSLVLIVRDCISPLELILPVVSILSVIVVVPVPKEPVKAYIEPVALISPEAET